MPSHFFLRSRIPAIKYIESRIPKNLLGTLWSSVNAILNFCFWKPRDCVFSHFVIDYCTNTCEKQRKPFGFGNFVVTGAVWVSSRHIVNISVIQTTFDQDFPHFLSRQFWTLREKPNTRKERNGIYDRSHVLVTKIWKCCKLRLLFRRG